METGSFNSVWCMCSLSVKWEVLPETRVGFGWPSLERGLQCDTQQRWLWWWHGVWIPFPQCTVTMMAGLATSETFMLPFLPPSDFGPFFLALSLFFSVSLFSWIRLLALSVLTGTDCQFKWLHRGVILLEERCDCVCLSEIRTFKMNTGLGSRTISHCKPSILPTHLSRCPSSTNPASESKCVSGALDVCPPCVSLCSPLPVIITLTYPIPPHTPNAHLLAEIEEDALFTIYTSI